MYSSNNILNGNNLISSSYDSTPFSFESNHTCSKDQYESETNIFNCPPLPFSFFQFPYSPFEDNNNQYFLQQHHDSNLKSLVPETTSTTPTTTHPLLVVYNNTDADASASMNHPPLPPAEEKGKKKIKEQILAAPTTTTKRTSKRDRHSKIKTARGLRDRRMRLSLEVAERFFRLQDMLGFEKASKTVEWLLNKSKLEIKELAKTNKNNLIPPITFISSTSECEAEEEEEGVSSLDEVMEDRDSSTVVVVKVKKIKRSSAINNNNKVFRKSAFSPISREKARERARERTREKIMKINAAAAEYNSKQCKDVEDDAKNNNINNLLWNPFDTSVEEESETAADTTTTTTHQSTDHLKNPSSFQEPSSQAIKEYSGTTVDNSLFIMSKWSPTIMFNSLNNSGLILQEHQFAQYRSLEKPWDAYNNRI